jgi:hypothetical protein
MAVSIFIIAFVLLAIYTLQSFLQQQESYTVNAYLSVETANYTLQNLLREIRNARRGDNGAYTLEIVNDQNLAFYTDTDNDGHSERIRYFLNGTVLKKGLIEPTGFPVTYPSQNEIITTVAENVRNGSQPLFYYYNSAWPGDTAHNPLVAASRQANTRMIKVHLIVNTNPTLVKADYDVQSQVQIRTLKDNL